MRNIALKVNGKKVPLSEFPADFIKNTMKGMLSTLKGVEEIQSVKLSFTIDE